MKIFKSKHKLQKEILNIKNISFVPTMGGLHAGHISLIKKAKKIKGKTLVSVFVNPKQFNDKKDYQRYPRNLKKDLILLKKLQVNLVYLPTSKDIFSFQTQNKIFIDKFSKKLCGKTRKGHFEGVLNIVNRFLEIIKPKFLFLGSKDFQQLSLISSHIKKKKINTKVIQCKTIRNKNGVALSTRNKNLTPNHLKITSKVYHYLKIKKKHIINRRSYFNLKIIKKDLINLGVTKIDYIELYNYKTFKKPNNKSEQFKIFIAFYLNKVRLIDNI